MLNEAVEVTDSTGDPSYKVFQNIDGEECLRSEHRTLEDAEEGLLEHLVILQRDRNDSWSIWHGKEGILVLWDIERGLRRVPKRETKAPASSIPALP